MGSFVIPMEVRIYGERCFGFMVDSLLVLLYFDV